MATTIFEQQTLTFYPNEVYGGLYFWNQTENYFVLNEGETYEIEWDGESFQCRAETMTMGELSGIGLGNKSIVGIGEDSGEPFIFAYVATENACLAIDQQETHTVGIYQAESGSEDEIVLKYFSNEEKKYSGVEILELITSDGGTQWFSKGEAVENVPISLDFSGGDQTVIAPEGTLVKSAVIIKPENLVPENIADGENVAGILGTHKGGGGNSETKFHEEPWLDDICFWDLEGNLLKNIPMSDAQGFTESDFPTAPTYDGLTFQSWNHSIDDIQTTEYPLDIAPIYSTTDGKTHIKLKAYSSSYSAFKFNFIQTVANGVSFDFGDGSAVQTVAGTGAVSITHTYSSATTTYELVISVADGCALTLGGGTSSTPFITGSTSTSSSTYHAAAIRGFSVGDNVGLNTYALNGCYMMEFLSLPQTLADIPASALRGLEKVKCAAIPYGVTAIGDYALNKFAYNYSDDYDSVISIPQSVQTIGASSLGDLYTIKRISIPRTVTSIPNSCISSVYKLKRVFWPDGIQTIGTGVLFGCYSLRKITIPENLVSIGNNFMKQSFSIDKVCVPFGVTTIGSSFLQETSAREVFIPASVTNIGSYFVTPTSSSSGSSIRKIVFADIRGLTLSNDLPKNIIEVVILSEAPSEATVLNRIITSTNYYVECFVPDEAVENYKALLSNYKYRIKPLSEYNGTLPEQTL